MPSRELIDLNLGPWRGKLIADQATPDALVWLESLETRMDSPDAALVYRVRNRIVRLPAPFSSAPDGVCVKDFAAPSGLQARRQAGPRGGKARRSFDHALHLLEHGVGVPAPIAYIERFGDGGLLGARFLSAYAADATSFDAEMRRLFDEDPDHDRFMRLLRLVAVEVRKMHDSGFIHHDLAGHNILLRRVGEADWADVVFIDLNRGRLKPALSLADRALDIARLQIPSNLCRVFHHIYFGDAPIPKEFSKREKLHRLRITFHNRTRPFRHPIRTRRLRKQMIDPRARRRPWRDMWLFDTKSGQGSVLLLPRDRLFNRYWRDLGPLIWQNLRALPAVWSRYRALRREAFARPIVMRDRAGLSLELAGDHVEDQFKLLEQHPDIPVMIRVYHHLGTAGLECCAAAVDRLAASGREVSLAVIQYRDSVLRPDAWREFVHTALDRMHSKVRHVEIGHAINRVKWGVWGLPDMLSLWNGLGDLPKRYPGIIFLGPAVNDFEYQILAPLLSRLRGRFHALSCHLYVDRVGAPENPQYGFTTDGKALLGRAIAEIHGLDGFYVTEVNWPLVGSGEYSPVQSAYALPGRPEHPLHVDEATSAAYMIRYFLATLCGGGAARVWWWRLAGHGIGLVDDLGGFRPRAGWRAFATWHRLVAPATFTGLETHGTVRVYRFDRGVIVWSPEPAEWRPDFPPATVLDLEGAPVPAAAALRIDRRPLYVWRESASPNA